MSPFPALLLVMSITLGAPPDTTLERELRARIAAYPGALVAVAWRDLGRGDSLFIDADTSLHAASTMKVPVMIELFRRVDAGELSLDDAVPLDNRFRSIVDGSPYALDAGDDSDSTLYARTGSRVPIRELIDRMIVRSSNLATNAVIDLAGGGERITRTMRGLGARDIQVRRGVEDIKAFRAGLNNTTTARDLAAILTALERGAAASPASTAAMREILMRQEFNDGIPAGLPPGVRVAHKTGWITGIHHDAAIVYPPDEPPYVLVILTRGIADSAAARALIAELAGVIHAHARSPRVK